MDKRPVQATRDTDLYKTFRGIDLTAGVDMVSEDAPRHPWYNVSSEQIEEMCNYMEKHRRDETIDEIVHLERLVMELDFFSRTNTLPFLYTTWKLIKKFEEDGVIWGVGRGSSCASYALYTLNVHDINPIKYQINFEEFSKEVK